jgi:predicted aldo/keto reductase-like oxidoreductase
MKSKSPEQNTGLLNDISPYIYGTTRLGHDDIPFDERVKIARLAMESGVWFHTSRQYNEALEVLRVAFDQDRTRVPKLIVKLGGDSIDEFRKGIYENIKPLNISKVDLGQLCIGGGLAKEFASGGNCYKEFEKIKSEGLVDRFVMEVFPWTSETPLKALKAGYTKGIVDGFIFYFNPLQRFASNELWNLLIEKNEAIIAMRTVSGGNVHRLRDIPGAAWKEYLQKRAVEVAPIYEHSGIESWTEFCIRFAFSFKQVRATVGSSGRAENLNKFLHSIQNRKPLYKETIENIQKLQQRWSDELDVHAEPWTM